MKKAVFVKMILPAILGLAIVSGSGCKKNNLTTLTLLSEPPYDGCGLPTGLSTLTINADIGDRYYNEQIKAFVSFFISTIPDGATIDSAILSIYQVDINHDGYELGVVLVDHVFYGIDTHQAFGIAALSSVPGTLATSFSVGYKDIDVTDEVQNDVDQNRERSQFRFFHTTPTNNNDDDEYDAWAMGESPANQPKLVVTYH